MLSGGVSCTGQAPGSRCSSSRSPLTRQLTRTRGSLKFRRCRIRKLPNQSGKPINSGRRSRRRLSASCGSKRRHRSGNVQRRRRRRRKRRKKTSEHIARGKKRTINWQRQPPRRPHRREKGQLRASRPPCNVLSGLAYPRATARATASDWRPHIPLDHDCRRTIPDIQPQAQLCYCAGVVSA